MEKPKSGNHSDHIKPNNANEDSSKHVRLKNLISGSEIYDSLHLRAFQVSKLIFL